MSRAGEGAGAGWLLTKLLQCLKVQPRAQNQPVLVFGVPKPEGLVGGLSPQPKLTSSPGRRPERWPRAPRILLGCGGPEGHESRLHCRKHAGQGPEQLPSSARRLGDWSAWIGSLAL